MSAPTYDAVPDLQPFRIWKGAVARAVQGERLTVGFLELEPNQDVPEHHHENEQVGFVLRGSITMVIGGDARTLGVGGTYVIPGDVPHSASTGPDGATVVDVFNPVRADWAQAERVAEAPIQWPVR
jgi:quercetin dioxygenase-like cupin family protein